MKRLFSLSDCRLASSSVSFLEKLNSKYLPFPHETKIIYNGNHFSRQRNCILPNLALKEQTIVVILLGAVCVQHSTIFHKDSTIQDCQ